MRVTQAIVGTALYQANYTSESAPNETLNDVVMERALGDHGGTMDSWYSTYEYRLSLRSPSARISAAVLIVAVLVVVIQFMLYLTIPKIYVSNSDLKPLIYNMVKSSGQEQSDSPYREYVGLEPPERRHSLPRLVHLTKESCNAESD